MLLALVVALSLPVKYDAQAFIVDENQEMDVSIGLSHLSASIIQRATHNKGVNNVEVYARMLKSSLFISRLSQAKVPPYHTDYYHYLLNNRHPAWWQRLLPDHLTETERVLGSINDNLQYNVDGKHRKVTIQVSDEDAAVAALMTDSACAILQQLITRARVNRAKSDLWNATVQQARARIAYDHAFRRYADYYDSHEGNGTPGEGIELRALQQDVQETFNNYTQASMQHARYTALSKRAVPSFAVLRQATVPMKASEPRTWAYVLVFVFIAWTFTSWGIWLRKTMEG